MITQYISIATSCDRPSDLRMSSPCGFEVPASIAEDNFSTPKQKQEAV